MKRALLIALAVVVSSGCLPTREGHPFGEDPANNGDGTNNGVSNNGTAGSNNGVEPNNGVTPDAGFLDIGNGGTQDAGTNGSPDAGGGMIDTGTEPPVDAGSDACVPESDQMFCERQGAECDVLASADNCGMRRSVDCGTCPNNNLCANNICGVCVPESNAAFCTRLMAECGQLSALDNCRVQRTANCGGCRGDGVGCNTQNSCQEVACRDGVDNDQAGGADCADSACLGQQCSGNPNKVCQADSTCK